MELVKLSKNDILKMDTEQVYNHLSNALKRATGREELTADEQSVYSFIARCDYLTAHVIYSNLLECQS